MPLALVCPGVFCGAGCSGGCGVTCGAEVAGVDGKGLLADWPVVSHAWAALAGPCATCGAASAGWNRIVVAAMSGCGAVELSLRFPSVVALSCCYWLCCPMPVWSSGP